MCTLVGIGTAPEIETPFELQKVWKPRKKRVQRVSQEEKRLAHTMSSNQLF